VFFTQRQRLPGAITVINLDEIFLGSLDRLKEKSSPETHGFSPSFFFGFL
jgi:hypothetical protein